MTEDLKTSIKIERVRKGYHIQKKTNKQNESLHI